MTYHELILPVVECATRIALTEAYPVENELIALGLVYGMNGLVYWEWR